MGTLQARNLAPNAPPGPVHPHPYDKGAPQ